MQKHFTNQSPVHFKSLGVSVVSLYYTISINNPTNCEVYTFDCFFNSKNICPTVIYNVKVYREGVMNKENVGIVSVKLQYKIFCGSWILRILTQEHKKKPMDTEFFNHNTPETK